MVAFTLSVFAILIFLWLAFGGSVPLKPEGYRFTVHMPEAATLAEEADVRMAGVNVGKVKTKELDKGGARTIVEVQLDEPYAPIPKDTKAILRQKTLPRPTSSSRPGTRRRRARTAVGSRTPRSRTRPSSTRSSPPSTRTPARRSRTGSRSSTAPSRRPPREDLSDAFGNFEGFAVDGAKLMQVLDEQDQAVHRLVKNTGRVFGAINERQARCAS